ncbi:MAG: hypothetical protein ACI90M_001783, partial [Candidatus Azotimanducaceae bacterium]
ATLPPLYSLAYRLAAASAYTDLSQRSGSGQ